MSVIVSKTKNRSTYRVLDDLSKIVLSAGEVKEYTMDKKELDEYLKKYTYRKTPKVVGAQSKSFNK